jgi:threonine aldolase
MAAGLAGLRGLTVEAPQTNILFVDVQGDKARTLLPFLASKGIYATGLYRLRFVTHLDVDSAGIDQAVAAIREHLEG